MSENEKPDSFQKGEAFEKYVRSHIFTEKHFGIVEKTHDYLTNTKDFVESSMNPDFLLRCKKTQRVFYTEIKYRNHVNAEGKYEWCKINQFFRYKKFAQKETTFIVLGMGGFAHEPKSVAVIPFEEIKYTALFPSFVNRYLVDLSVTIDNKMVWEMAKVIT